MHEYHAIEALVEELTSRIDDPVLRGVTEVRIRASPVFAPESLEQAYEMLTRDTRLDRSRLLVEEAADERVCAACGLTWVVSRDDVVGHALVCPSCGELSGVEGGAGIEVVEVVSRR